MQRAFLRVGAEGCEAHPAEALLLPLSKPILPPSHAVLAPWLPRQLRPGLQMHLHPLLAGNSAFTPGTNAWLVHLLLD